MKKREIKITKRKSMKKFKKGSLKKRCYLLTTKTNVFYFRKEVTKHIVTYSLELCLIVALTLKQN